MESIKKRAQYQQLGKGKVMRRMEKLTLADYFACGGKSVEHYNSITLMKEVVLKDLKADELKVIIYQLENNKRIMKPEKTTNEVFIKIISELK